MAAKKQALPKDFGPSLPPQALIELGADVPANDDNGNTTLHFAAGAKVDALNHAKLTPRSIAAVQDVAKTATACAKLCRMFGVDSPEPGQMHATAVSIGTRSARRGSTLGRSMFLRPLASASPTRRRKR